MAEAKYTITAQDRTKRALSSAKRRLQGVKRAVFSLKGALVGAAGAAGFGALIKRSFAANDALAKTADRRNVTTQELSALHRLTELSGQSQERMDKALESLSRRVGQAAQGFGQAQRALDKLNLDAERLQNLSPAEQFEIISQKVSCFTAKESSMPSAIR